MTILGAIGLLAAAIVGGLVAIAAHDASSVIKSRVIVVCLQWPLAVVIYACLLVGTIATHSLYASIAPAVALWFAGDWVVGGDYRNGTNFFVLLALAPVGVAELLITGFALAGASAWAERSRIFRKGSSSWAAPVLGVVAVAMHLVIASAGAARFGIATVPWFPPVPGVRPSMFNPLIYCGVGVWVVIMLLREDDKSR